MVRSLDTPLEPSSIAGTKPPRGKPVAAIRGTASHRTCLCLESSRTTQIVRDRLKMLATVTRDHIMTTAFANTLTLRSIEAGAAKILIDAFLSDNRSWDKG